ncbi:transposase [uncultured archaeon]|nr:transposase [uncultured archaeon]AKA48723.1 transposase [uncultured archaeon]AKA49545.1 transposase [uncultured archaeon]
MTPQQITAIGNRSTRRYWVGSNRRHDRYNRSLVNRVEDLMDPSFLMNWKNLLQDNNRGKRGHPFKTPNAFITFLAKLRALYSVPFRSLEGIARVFSRISGIRTVCYTNIFRRIRKIVPTLPHTDGKPVDCAIDSTGFKITIRGDYLGTKWNRRRRGWNKLHAVISIHDVSVLSFSITDEHVHDAKEGRKILESVRDRILRIYGDKGYDSKKIFNDFGHGTIIPPRKNASTQSRGSPARAKVVRQIRRTSEKRWKESVQYGKRWNVEIYFSGLKRTMGEVIKAVRSDYIVQEIALKVQYYNIMREMTHAY